MNPVDPLPPEPPAAALRRPVRRVATIVIDRLTLEFCSNHAPIVVRRALWLLWQDSLRADRPWRGSVPHVPIAKAARRVSVSIPPELAPHLDARCAETGASAGDVLNGLLRAYRRRVLRKGKVAMQTAQWELPPPKRGRARPWRRPRP